MPMYPCTKCLERNWKFELPDRETVRATCQNCGHEAEFASRKQKQQHRGKHHRPARSPEPHVGPPEAVFDAGQVGNGVAPW